MCIASWPGRRAQPGRRAPLGAGRAPAQASGMGSAGSAAWRIPERSGVRDRQLHGARGPLGDSRVQDSERRMAPRCRGFATERVWTPWRLLKRTVNRLALPPDSATGRLSNRGSNSSYVQPGAVRPASPCPKPACAWPEPGCEPRLAATQAPANRLAIPAGSAAGHLSTPTKNSSVRYAETLVRILTVKASASPRTIGVCFARNCSSTGPRRRIEPLAAETAVPGNAAELGHQRVQQAAVLGGHDISREAARAAQFLGRRVGLVDACQTVILSPPSRFPRTSPACAWC